MLEDPGAMRRLLADAGLPRAERVPSSVGVFASHWTFSRDV